MSAVQKSSERPAAATQQTRQQQQDHPVLTTSRYSSAEPRINFDMNFTMSSKKGVQLHKVIRTILQDQRVEIIEANSSYVDDSEIIYVLKCKVYI
jgi:hypothetical protein